MSHKLNRSRTASGPVSPLIGARHGFGVPAHRIFGPADRGHGRGSGRAEPPADSGGGKLRTYYIAADEVIWDYAPSGTNMAEGRAFNDLEKPWMEPGPHIAGRKAKKALYREYTDATFTTLKPRPAEWEHLGFLGPLIRAEVGDTIKVVFKNNTKFAAASIRTASSTRKTPRGRTTTTARPAARRPTTRATGRHTHLHLGGARARGPDRSRRQHGAVGMYPTRT